MQLKKHKTAKKIRNLHKQIRYIFVSYSGEKHLNAQNYIPESYHITEPESLWGHRKQEKSILHPKYEIKCFNCHIKRHYSKFSVFPSPTSKAHTKM